MPMYELQRVFVKFCAVEIDEDQQHGDRRSRVFNLPRIRTTVEVFERANRCHPDDLVSALRRGLTPGHEFAGFRHGGNVGGDGRAHRPSLCIRCCLPRCRGAVRPRHHRAARYRRGRTGICRFTVLSKARDKVVGVVRSQLPATEDFSNSASVGANDARAHVQTVAETCPNTRMVLGGYSQGALVIDLITAFPVALAGFTPAPSRRGGRSRCCCRRPRKPIEQISGGTTDLGKPPVRPQGHRPVCPR